MQFFKDNSFIFFVVILAVMGVHFAMYNSSVKDLIDNQKYLASEIEMLNKKGNPMGDATDADIFYIKNKVIDSAITAEDIKCKILHGTGYSWSESYYGCEKVEFKASK